MAAQNTAHTSGKCAVTKFNHEKSQQQSVRQVHAPSMPCAKGREKKPKNAAAAAPLKQSLLSRAPRHDFVTLLEVILPG
jgi:hypothetical protein